MLKGSSLLSLEFASISPLEIEDGDQSIVESTWSDIIRLCNETAESVWDMAENSRKEKSQREPDMCPRLILRVNEVCKIKDQQVRRSAQRDKSRAFVEELASEVEKAAAKEDLDSLQDNLKQLSGQSNTYIKPVKTKKVKVITTTEMEKASRWIQYFKDVLNRPEFNEIADLDPSDYFNINPNQPSQVEDETATKAIKNGKTPGINN